MNSQAGAELQQNIKDASNGWVVPYEEAERWNNKRREELRRWRDHRCRPVACGFHRKGDCRDEHDCAYVHMVKETHLKSRIFGGIFNSEQ